MRILWFSSLAACTPGTSDSGSAADTATATLTPPGSPGTYLSISELWLAWDGTTLGGFALEDGTEVVPQLTVEFFTDDWMPAQDPSERCAWTGRIDSTTIDSGELWAGFTVIMSTISSDCSDWPGVEAAMTAPRWIGLGSLGSPHSHAVREYFGQNGAEWSQWQDQIASFWAEVPGGARAEVGYALVYPLDDGVLVTEDGIHSPLRLDDSMPYGAVHALGMYSFSADAMLADYRE